MIQETVNYYVLIMMCFTLAVGTGANNRGHLLQYGVSQLNTCYSSREALQNLPPYMV